MDKINFENLPSTNTSINAENLNKVQDNVEKAIPEIVDNLTTDDVTKVLSAKQGKALNEKISGIIESGSNANGNYIKYAEGTMICYKQVRFGNMSIRNPWGAFYESEKLNIGNYAQPFKEEPRTFIMPVNKFFVERSSDMNATSFGSFYATRPVASDLYVTVDCLAIGKWK